MCIEHRGSYTQGDRVLDSTPSDELIAAPKRQRGSVRLDAPSTLADDAVWPFGQSVPVIEAPDERGYFSLAGDVAGAEVVVGGVNSIGLPVMTHLPG